MSVISAFVVVAAFAAAVLILGPLNQTRVAPVTTGSEAVVDGRTLVNFANYNYLGLSGDADVTRAAQHAVARWGSSVSASRVVSGERPIHRELEQEIARFLRVDEAGV